LVDLFLGNRGEEFKGSVFEVYDILLR